MLDNKPGPNQAPLVPEEIWKLVTELQTHPISSNLGAQLTQNDELKKANSSKLQKLLANLKEEEDADEACRVGYGAAFKMDPSSKANADHKTKLTSLAAKIN